ncbi:CvpA family protein [Aureibaculum sp. 2210JD6-5]|uniref:CvpA family protein n=1 Tax=Aureibaculum sp. 2210JD6-5 TaxID=3103957 RepID=UPI002AADEA89|nr:CvpA family protein [Aureibaculum sp. 2210JD6-5]MDY7395944.1 CvpA family protein [Aureibaculum sp. 2210JD6-5]
MNTLDIILAALLLFGLVRGFMKGFIVEIAGLAALALGLYGAIHFSHFASGYIENNVSWNEKQVQIASFAVTFLVIIIAISLAGKLLTKVADIAALGIFNKILGGLFGAAKIGLILSVVLVVFSKLNRTVPFLSDEQMAESQLYEPVKNIVPMVFPTIVKERETQNPAEGDPE